MSEQTPEHTDAALLQLEQRRDTLAPKGMMLDEREVDMLVGINEEIAKRRAELGLSQDTKGVLNVGIIQ